MLEKGSNFSFLDSSNNMQVLFQNSFSSYAVFSEGKFVALNVESKSNCIFLQIIFSLSNCAKLYKSDSCSQLWRRIGVPCRIYIFCLQCHPIKLLKSLLFLYSFFSKETQRNKNWFISFQWFLQTVPSFSCSYCFYVHSVQ